MRPPRALFGLANQPLLGTFQPSGLIFTTRGPSVVINRRPRKFQLRVQRLWPIVVLKRNRAKGRAFKRFRESTWKVQPGNRVLATNLGGSVRNVLAGFEDET